MSAADTFMSDTLKQFAVWWPKSADPGDMGRTWGTVSEISVRWITRGVLFTDVAGKEQRSEAVVYCQDDVSEEDYIYFGRLADLSGAEQADPFQVQNSREVRRFEKTPSIDADVFVRRAFV